MRASGRMGSKVVSAVGGKSTEFRTPPATLVPSTSATGRGAAGAAEPFPSESNGAAGLSRPVAVTGAMMVPALEILGPVGGRKAFEVRAPRLVHCKRVVHPLQKLLLDQSLVYAEICGHLRVVAPITPVAGRA